MKIRYMYIYSLVIGFMPFVVSPTKHTLRMTQPSMSTPGYSMSLKIREMPPHTVTRRPIISNTTLSAYMSITLPLFSHIMPVGGSAFDQLLEEQRSKKVGNCRELDYISVTAYSPLHGGVGQQAPTWIVTHLGVGKEGKVSE